MYGRLNDPNPCIWLPSRLLGVTKLIEGRPDNKAAVVSEVLPKKASLLVAVTETHSR